MTNRPGPLAQRIAAELRAELGRQNLSRRWLAEQIDQSHVTVSRWVNGDGGMTFDALDAMCKALGMSVADLLDAAERHGEVVPSVLPRRARRGGMAVADRDLNSSRRASRDTDRCAAFTGRAA